MLVCSDGVYHWFEGKEQDKVPANRILIDGENMYIPKGYGHAGLYKIKSVFPIKMTSLNQIMPGTWNGKTVNDEDVMITYRDDKMEMFVNGEIVDRSRGDFDPIHMLTMTKRILCLN